jgi:hypothetical protein
LFAFVVFFSSAALAPFVGLPTEGYRWQPYADAYTPAMLDINHTSGMPGSFFTVTGTNFPPDSTLTVLANSFVLGTVQTDSAGGFVFLIDTTGADPGFYVITTDLPNSPLVRFLLSLDEPLYPQEGEGTIFTLPSGIGQIPINLPIIMR